MWPIECSTMSAIIIHQLIDLCEELPVVMHANVLKHADRNDAVEAFGDVAIVPQLEAHTIGKSKPPRLLIGEGMLFLWTTSRR